MANTSTSTQAGTQAGVAMSFNFTPSNTLLLASNQLPPGVTLEGNSLNLSNLKSGAIVDLQAGTVVGGGVPPFHIPTNLTQVFGTGHGDIIFGNNLPDSFIEYGGNNILIGRSGSASFSPGPGSNVILGTGSNNTVSYYSEGSVQVNLATHLAVKNHGTDQLSGINNINGSVNTDTLVGDSGNNVISGVYGPDTMTGGGGHDTFRFTDRGPAPTITDFVSGQDLLSFFRNEIFIPDHRPPEGTLPPQYFTVGTQATTPTQLLIFNPTDHTLYYDPDGSGGQYQPTPLVHLPGATLAASDIVAM